ncbi:MAG TPA: hypothetical protein VKY24_00945 [Reyranella sp.]|nr:hypothetical protein [Reyranella sp.]
MSDVSFAGLRQADGRFDQANRGCPGWPVAIEAPALSAHAIEAHGNRIELIDLERRLSDREAEGERLQAERP